jgi:hypothetical protein
MEVGALLDAPTTLTALSTHSVGEWVEYRTCVDTLEKTKFS